MMTAAIIKHAETADVADDPKHPIPALGVIDVHGVRKTGGADLHIVIASPLRADERSQKRLLDKIEGYLGFILSEEYKTEAGTPTPRNTNIIVDIHPDSDKDVFNLLERCKPWALANQTTIVVKLLKQEFP